MAMIGHCKDRPSHVHTSSGLPEDLFLGIRCRFLVWVLVSYSTAPYLVLRADIEFWHVCAEAAVYRQL